MFGPAVAATALAAAVVAWGVPAGVSPPAPGDLPSIFGPDTALAPDAKVEGNTDKEIVRRIIRRHINEVKKCYEQELSRLPDLAGKIDVQFTIAASGQVIASTLQRSTSMAAADLGFTGDADLAAWPAALRSVRTRYNDLVIVPGHGPVDRAGQAYQHTLDLLAAVTNGSGAKM